MHYYIDGYNVLFRMNHESRRLQALREQLIQDLNRKISLLNLNVTVVFDAMYFEGGRSRSNFDALTILFTASGESADKYIIDAILNSPNRKREVVVTSDKTLALHVRHLSAKVESVEEFLRWLNNSYENRLKGPKKEKSKLKIIPKTVVEVEPPKPKEGEADYYQQVFELEFEQIREAEELKRKVKKESVVQKPRTPKVKRDPFQEPPLVLNEADEMERWLKAFEDNLRQEKGR